jgi:hypothetical protein
MVDKGGHPQAASYLIASWAYHRHAPLAHPFLLGVVQTLMMASTQCAYSQLNALCNLPEQMHARPKLAKSKMPVAALQAINNSPSSLLEFLCLSYIMFAQSPNQNPADTVNAALRSDSTQTMVSYSAI